MIVQEWYRKKPMATMIGLAALATLSVLALLFSLGVFSKQQPHTSSKFYYYDTQTNELFADESSLFAPIKAPSGGEGVSAQVYACGSNSDDLFIALLRKYTPQAKQAWETDAIPPPNGELIRLPNANSKWMIADSEAGRKIKLDAAAAVRAYCGDKTPRIVMPE